MSHPNNPQEESPAPAKKDSESADKNTTAGDERVKEAAEESAEKGLPYETPKPKSVEQS